MAYMAEDETGQTQIADYLELLAAQRFHGQLDFGNAGYHFAVVRVTVNAKGEWGLEDEDCPYGHDQDLRRPLGFEIEGVEGKWCLIFTPLS